MGTLRQAIGSRLARYLTAPRPDYVQHDTAPLERVIRSLEPGDIVLVDGTARVSTALKYLTQSTWSHSCLFTGPPTDDPDACSLIEADLIEGVIRVPLSKYADNNLRICRPVGVEPQELHAVVGFAESRLGHQYDLKNITDLARYLIRVPWVPTPFRRRMITLGSGEPTRAICSTLIAEAYQSIRYPILPHYTDAPDAAGEIELMARHHTLFVPGDFDLSPYFRIIKPTIEHGFDFHQLSWKEAVRTESAPTAAPQTAIHHGLILRRPEYHPPGGQDARPDPPAVEGDVPAPPGEPVPQGDPRRSPGVTPGTLPKPARHR